MVHLSDPVGIIERMHTNIETVWTSGDPWRDLTEELDDLGDWTAISRSGTARLVRNRQTIRMPLEGGNRLVLDGQWNPVARLIVTPCGIVYDGLLGDWSVGTQLWVVLTGVQPAWNTTALGRQILDRVVARELPEAPGHPAEPCGARYCHVRLPGLPAL